MNRPVCIATFLILSLPQLASPQSPPTIAAGTRIRITQHSAMASSGPQSGQTTRTVLSGTLVRSAPDSVVLGLDGGDREVAFSRDQLSRFEVSNGVATHMAANAGKGFLMGVGVGAIAGLVLCNCTTQYEDLRGLGAVVGAVLGGAGGGVLGMMVGSQPTERWSTVPLTTLGIYDARRATSFAVGVSFRF